MPVLPALQQILDAIAASPPPPEGASVAEARANAHAMMEMSFSALQEPGPDVAQQTDHQVPVDGGEITVRVYRPEGEAPFPCHLYIHGGGFWLGNLDMSDDFCKAVAVGASCVVVSVDYRLAPEAKFPVPAEDCYAALQWVVDHAGDLGVDPGRISVGGGSAGGNLSAVTALLARDRNGPPLVLQVLEIPVTDLTMSQPSVRSNGAGYMLTTEAMAAYRDHYLADPADATNPYASPLLAEDLTGLPPAVVMTAEFDPLRDEGEAYAKRLEEAGVPVSLTRWEGQFHGSQMMGKLIPEESAAYLDAVVRALREAYGIS
jgi:acetyl esterase